MEAARLEEKTNRERKLYKRRWTQKWRNVRSTCLQWRVCQVKKKKKKVCCDEYIQWRRRRRRKKNLHANNKDSKLSWRWYFSTLLEYFGDGVTLPSFNWICTRPKDGKCLVLQIFQFEWYTQFDYVFFVVHINRSWAYVWAYTLVFGCLSWQSA